MSSVQIIKLGYRAVFGAILLELMLAVTLSLLLLAFLLQMYSGSYRSYQDQLSIVALQIHAQKAIDILSAELHQAGHIGCAKVSEKFPVIGYGKNQLNAENKITSTREMITIRHASSRFETLDREMNDLINLHLSRRSKFRVGSVLIVSDCTKAEIFKVADVRDGVIVAAQPLHAKFSRGSEVSHFEVNQFYVSQDHILTRVNYDGIKSLLVPGVIAMNIDLKRYHGRLAAIAIEIFLHELSLKKSWYLYAAI